MALSVVIRSGEVETPPTITFDAPRVVLGRGAGCDVCLPDPTISHRHASLRQRGADYIVVDEASTNGTFVGHVRLPPHTPRVLRSGDLLRLGRIWLEILIEPSVPTQQPQIATREIALALVAKALAVEGSPCALQVRITGGPDSGKTLDLVDFDRPYVLGRGPTAALSFSDPDVSRRHVELVRRGAKVLVRELSSRNGGTLGGTVLEADRETVWRPGVALQIGQSVLTYEDPVADALLDLEQAADERMRDDESVEPPASRKGPEEPARVAEGASRSEPTTELPRRRRRPSARRSWSGTDYLVALFALAVAALSLVGLMWLLGSE